MIEKIEREPDESQHASNLEQAERDIGLEAELFGLRRFGSSVIGHANSTMRIGSGRGAFELKGNGRVPGGPALPPVRHSRGKCKTFDPQKTRSARDFSRPTRPSL